MKNILFLKIIYLKMNFIWDLKDKTEEYLYLDEYSSSEAGILFEKFIKLLIICNKFFNYQLLDKNYKPILNKEEYLKKSKIIDSCLEGKIDIKLFNGNYLFVSCKYYEEEKTLDKYGILEMNEEIKNKGINNYSLGIFIRNKNEFIKKYNRSRNNNIKKLINLDNIYDYNYFLNIINDFKFDISMLLTNKPELNLREYQLNIINKIKQGNNLIGACPRSGKSYMIGGFIDKEKINNVLIITPIIKETKTQWIEDIFNKYSNFNDYQILNPLSNIELNNIELKDKNIIIISKQLLQNHYKEFDYKPNLLVFDEHDFHGTTELSKDIINKYETKYNIYLTATYYKSLLNIKKLNKILFTYEDLRKYEQGYPEPIYFTPRFETNYFNKINDNLEDNFNFNYSLLFEIDSKTKKFKYDEKVRDFVSYYLSGNKICPNIHPISKRIDKYLMKQSTQLWFLPLEHIDEISKNLKNVLNEDLYYRDYDVICINSKKKIENINYLIEEEENKIINENKKGLIILVGGMLQRGITLKRCSVVFFLNNSSSYEKYIQCKFRCLSEYKDKKYGIIVDFDINRILSLIINYSNDKINYDMSIEDKIKIMLEEKLINFDPDMLETYEFDGDKSLNNLLELWNNNPLNQFKIFKNTLIEHFEDLDIIINKELLKIFESIKILEEKTKKEIDKDRITIIDELIKDDNIPKNELKKKKEEILKENEKVISELETKKKISKEIIPYIIPLSCILTYDNNEKEFIKLLNIIRNNEILKEIFNSQCELIWEKSGFLDFIIQLVNDLNINPSNWISNIKYNINKLLNYPDKLIDFINECLIIKGCEREKNGEVPTPLWIINKLLDELEKYDKDIFKKKLKWFDHSCGIGNFMVCLYMRLIKYHTREEIINEMLYMCEYNRKNVFIIKLIFGKDCHIYQGSTIDILKEKIKGINILEYFGFNEFDIILGNPPFNFNGIKTCKGNKLNQEKTNITIWPDFINFSIKILKENGWFISINPTTWIKSTSKMKYLLNYQINYLELWDSTYAKQKINAEQPISLYILNKTKSINKTLIKTCNQRHNIFNEEFYKINNNHSLPFCYFSIFDKLYNITKKYGKFNISNKKIKGIGDKIEINKINQKEINNYGIDTYLHKETKGLIGLIVKKINIKDIIDEHKNKKIIIANKSKLKYSIIDNIGYNICGNDNLYIINNNENELNIIYNYFNSSLINFICKNMKYRGQFIEKFTFDFIPNILNFKNGLNDILKLFNNDEIKIINNF